MEEILTSLDVSHLSDEMVRAAQNFAGLKFNIDMLGKSWPEDIPDDLHGPMRGGEYGPEFASSFFTAIIPFFLVTRNPRGPLSVRFPLRIRWGVAGVGGQTTNHLRKTPS